MTIYVDLSLETITCFKHFLSFCPPIVRMSNTTNECLHGVHYAERICLACTGEYIPFVLDYRYSPPRLEPQGCQAITQNP